MPFRQFLRICWASNDLQAPRKSSTAHIRLASEHPNPHADATACTNSSSPSSDNSTSETDNHSMTPIPQSHSRPMAVIDPNNIIGRTYLSAPEEEPA